MPVDSTFPAAGTLTGAHKVPILQPDVGSSTGYINVNATLTALAAYFATGGAVIVAGARFVADTGSTADSDPGVGLAKWNNASQSAATILFVSDETADGADVSALFAALVDGGFAYLQSTADPDAWSICEITSVVDAVGYTKLGISVLAIGAAIADGDEIAITLQQAAGSIGATDLADLDDVDVSTPPTDGQALVWDSGDSKWKPGTVSGGGGASIGVQYLAETGSAADSDPGAGQLRWNNGTQGSATVLFLDDASADGASLTGWWPTLMGGGFAYLQHATDQDVWQIWEITGLTDATGYVKLAVVLQAKGDDFVDSDPMLVTLEQGLPPGSDPRGRHAVPIMAGAMTPAAASGCATLATIASATDQPDIQTLNFDAAAVEYAQFAIPMPASWNEGTVTFAPIWSHDETTTNFGVVWQLQAVAVSNDDTIAANFGTAQTSTDTGGTTNDIYIGPESSAITIAGSPAPGDVVFFRFGRLVTDGADTMAVDARLHGIVLYMTTNAATDA